MEDERWTEEKRPTQKHCVVLYGVRVIIMFPVIFVLKPVFQWLPYADVSKTKEFETPH